MPVLNAAPTLREALVSVLDAPEVGQVVLVDDGSTDGSVVIARVLGDARIEVVPGPRSGLVGVYNAGWEATRCPYVAVCDADDLCEPGRFAWQVAFLERARGHVAVVGAFATTDSRLRVRVPMPLDRAEGDIDAALRDGDPVAHQGAWLCRREDVQRLGGRRAWFEIGDDLDLLCRIGFVGKVRFIPRPAYVYRLHDRSITHRLTLARMQFYRDAARDFARQRRETGSDDLDRGCPPVFDASAAPPRVDGAAAHISGHLMGYAHHLRQAGRLADALRAAGWAVRLDPISRPAWRTLAGVAAQALRPRRR